MKSPESPCPPPEGYKPPETSPELEAPESTVVEESQNLTEAPLEPSELSETPEESPETSKPLNFFQKIAKKTHNILTPANLISVGGLALTIAGLDIAKKGQLPLGFALTGIGFGGDAVDGTVARATETPSKLGEKVDVFCDFGKAAATAGYLHVMDLLPAVYSGMIFGPKVINAATSVTGFLTHKEPTKNNFDRYTEVARYIAASLIVANNLIRPGQPINTFNTVVAGAVGGLGLVGSYNQARRNLNPEKYAEQERQKAEIKENQRMRRQMRTFAKTTGAAMPRFK